MSESNDTMTKFIYAVGWAVVIGIASGWLYWLMYG